MSDGAPAAIGRYAVYFAPISGSPLARFGARWLGHDLETGAPPTQPTELSDAGRRRLPRPLEALTERPRHYGFHATLKPPFRLADGQTADHLIASVGALASRLTSPPPLPLAPTALGGFIALTPVEPTPALNALAAACVTELDAFRAPLSDADRAKRPVSRLSAREAALQEAWGYPHVLEEFRFHMTLSGRLPPADAQALVDLLQDPEATPLPEILAAPIPMVDLCLCIEPAPLAADAAPGPFRLLSRHALGSGSAG